VPASIGDQPQGGRGFDGLIDDVRIYSRALGQSEIAAIMTELLGLPSAEPADTTPPISPDNLIAKVLTSTSIELTWQASTDASGIAYYEILRDGIILSTATGTSLADSGLDPGATYHYRVRAVDSAGNTSAPSSEVVVQMPTGIPTDPALMLAFAFEEDGIYALDQTANENDGLLTGAVDRTNVKGSNGVVVFQGGKIDLGGLDIPGSAMTISCWVFAHSFGQDTRIVSKATGIYENDHVWMLSTTTSNGIKPRMRLKTGNGDTTTLIGTVNLTVGVWTHLAATYDGRVMALWVNAQPAGFVSKAGSIIQSPTVPASIGDQPQGGHSFDGLMDDFRIYTRALTQSELQELAAASQP
jgi:chitodextrinase